MKRIAFVFCLFFLAYPLLAEEKEKEIKLELGELYDDTRSLVSVPTITHDGATLYFYSEVTLEDVKFQIKDAFSGEVVFSGNVYIRSNTSATIIPTYLSEGYYLLEIKISSNTYRGIFEIQ
ncbi:MAG: DUF3244 domain-containing protein [Bacteroides sp.]|nr:DUF3244 domain-containing protein [Bacteroides sp.]